MEGDNGQGSKPLMQVTIDVFKDGRVEVLGFPSNYSMAMDVMTAGVKRVSNFFLGLQREGKLDDKMNIKQSPIIQPTKGPIVVPQHGRPL